jgi:hypothetical protein
MASSARDYDRVLRFLHVFESVGFRYGGYEATSAGTFAHPILAPEVLDFVDTLYGVGWVLPFDWPEWQPTAEDLLNDPEKLEAADLVTIQKLLTVHVRKDRFCDGHLLGMLQCGHIVAILRRLKSLVDHEPPTLLT